MIFLRVLRLGKETMKDNRIRITLSEDNLKLLDYLRSSTGWTNSQIINLIIKMSFDNQFKKEEGEVTNEELNQGNGDYDSYELSDEE